MGKGVGRGRGGRNRIEGRGGRKRVGGIGRGKGELSWSTCVYDPLCSSVLYLSPLPHFSYYFPLFFSPLFLPQTRWTIPPSAPRARIGNRGPNGLKGETERKEEIERGEREISCRISLIAVFEVRWFPCVPCAVRRARELGEEGKGGWGCLLEGAVNEEFTRAACSPRS